MNKKIYIKNGAELGGRDIAHLSLLGAERREQLKTVHMQIAQKSIVIPNITFQARVNFRSRVIIS